ncbi:MAG: flagellar biosynthesis protein FlhB [Gemmatimonadota bacterium]
MSDSGDSSSQEKTESATPRRREQAREEGKIARSQDLITAGALLAGTAALATFGGAALANQVTRLFQESAQSLASGALDVESASALLRGVGLGTLLAILPFGATVMAAVVFIGVLQSRGLVSGKVLMPQFSRISPLSGIKKLVSMDAMANLVRSFLKMIALGLITYSVLHGSWAELTALSNAGPDQTFVALRSLVLKLVTVTGLAFLALAVGDYLYQVYSHEKGMRMSRQEIVREMRESEGDPMIKSRIRAIARNRARQRMLQQVPKADVVIVNPTHVAVALRYDPAEQSAPVVVAMGERKLAERIKALALASNVPLIENRPVARALLATAIVGKPIPPALYAAVAEILAFIYRRKRGLPARLAGMSQ